MGKRTLLTIVAAAVVAGLLVANFGCASGSAEYAEAVKQEDASNVAPDFTLTDIEGKQFKLSDTEGQVRLVDFWATWCAPCREEIPMLKELEKTYGPQGLTMVAISDEDRDVIAEFVSDQGIEYTNLCDSGDVMMEYSVFGLPTAFLIGPDGSILEHYTGPKPRSVLEADIREALNLPPST
ncbi:TlpA family protein disulfide reductase [bacterium]|nr:TlpA family protein disulfide reductase [bacterium]